MFRRWQTREVRPTVLVLWAILSGSAWAQVQTATDGRPSNSGLLPFVVVKSNIGNINSKSEIVADFSTFDAAQEYASRLRKGERLSSPWTYFVRERNSAELPGAPDPANVKRPAGVRDNDGRKRPAQGQMVITLEENINGKWVEVPQNRFEYKDREEFERALAAYRKRIQDYNAQIRGGERFRLQAIGERPAGETPETKSLRQERRSGTEGATVDLNGIKITNVWGVNRPPQEAKKVKDACDKQFEDNKDNCSGFVRAVVQQAAHFSLEGDADTILGSLSGKDSAWIKLRDGKEAKEKADAGWLVIGGLRGKDHKPARDHGHVVLVVSGPLARGKYPTAYWGSLGAEGKKNFTVNFAWNKNDRDNVEYYARKLPAAKSPR